MTENRTLLLKKWLSNCFSIDDISLTAMTGDAGFRRYYRLEINQQTYVVVDAPNDKSNNQGFVSIQQAFAENNLLVPDILFHQAEYGFFCLSDLGKIPFSEQVALLIKNDEHNSVSALASIETNSELSNLYQHAINLLPNIQRSQITNAYKLPCYDESLLTTELHIFPEWLLTQHLSIELTATEQAQLAQCFQLLIDNALEQPQVVVHRDYHSRNLMMLDEDKIGIIDFQDAVYGPITYDVVSLLRDCYQELSFELVQQLFDNYRQQLIQNSHLSATLKQVDLAQWQRWFDLMGIQRHIKASGIFARLLHRDDKPTYIDDIPLTLKYIVDVSARYPELAFLTELVNDRVLPELLSQQRTNNTGSNTLMKEAL